MSNNSFVTGFPRIGEQRELKRVLEEFWADKCSFEKVKETAKKLKTRHWNYQKNAGIGYISTNDFSLYDTVLDTSVMLGAVPKRFKDLKDEKLYFAMARGDKHRVACEMTKWFNTNYHYIVPELSPQDNYRLNSKKIIEEYKEAVDLGLKPKINLIGILTYLGLSKRVDGGDTYELWNKIIPLYEELLEEINKLDSTVLIQFDEPIFATDTNTKVLSLIKPTYDRLAKISKVVVTTYFEHAKEAVKILLNTPVWGVGLDFVYGKENFDILTDIQKSNKILVAGIVNGRNIWINDFQKSLNLLKQIERKINKNRIIISSSCSLQHVPFTLKYEEKMDEELKSWLSFAVEKLDEIILLEKLFFDKKLNRKETELLKSNQRANKNRKNSSKIHNTKVQKRVEKLSVSKREEKFAKRIKLQRKILDYSDLTTTTIGSFPQTPEVRLARGAFKKGLIAQDEYIKEMKAYIDKCIKFQEECGLDVLVHGEPERNDMVEYFAEELDGYGFSQNGWVQSYGSRCVKPPFIYGDISREKPITVDWITYAQSKTQKIVKGMLTGPVTMLNWSFVRDDKPRNEVSKQIAIALSDEVDDLQNAGIKIIQVDEAAFKEGYPLRKSKIKEYENWAVRDFRITVSKAKPVTQIHTHMCYSEFNEIIKTIEAMDADVITIETARSGNELLKVFAKIGYKAEIGPGVYDIHSPRVPSVEEIKTQIKLLLQVLPKEQLWINPDCGLKTRKWNEVKPALKNMVKAVKEIKGELKND